MSKLLRQQAERLMRKSTREYQYGNYRRALKLALKSEAFFTKAEKKPDVMYVSNLMNIAEIKYVLGVYEECEVIYRRLLKLIPEVMGEDDFLMNAVLFNLAGICSVKGDKTEALGYYRRVIERGDWGETIVTQSWQNVADILQGFGDHEGAIAAYQKVLATVETHGKEIGADPLIGLILKKYALSLEATGEIEEAKRLSDRARDVLN